MPQVWKGSKPPSMLKDHDGNENNYVSDTEASWSALEHCADNWGRASYKTKTERAAIALNATKRGCVPVQCRPSVNTVSHNAWLNSTALTCITERPHEELTAQRLRFKHVFWQARATTARRVRNDWKLLKVEDAEVNVSMKIRHAITLYQRTTLRNAKDDELPSWLK